MPSFLKLIQLISLFYISASAVSAVGTGNFDDADNEHLQAQAEISRVIAALRKMADKSMPEFCLACSEAIGDTQFTSNPIQLNYGQDSPRDDLTNTQKYFRAHARKIAVEKYEGKAIPEENQLAECTILLRGSLLQHLRKQYLAFEKSNPNFDVLGLAYGNRNWDATPESIVVALQQFTTEVQYDSERYSCNEFFGTKGATAMSNVIDPSSSSGPVF